MKTTIEIADPLLQKAKALAKKKNTTLRALIEEGLQLVLGQKEGARPLPIPDASVHGQGLTPEMEARGGWANLRRAAYAGFFDDDQDPQS